MKGRGVAAPLVIRACLPDLVDNLKNYEETTFTDCYSVSHLGTRCIGLVSCNYERSKGHVIMLGD